MSSIYETRFWTKSYNWKAQKTINYPKTFAYFIFRDAAAYHPDKVATWFYGAEMTYRELYRKVCRLANVFVERDKKGDRIGLLMPNCPQFVIAYWAISWRAVVVNLNPCTLRKS